MDLKVAESSASPAKRLLFMTTSPEEGRPVCSLLEQSGFYSGVSKWLPGQPFLAHHDWHCIVLHITRVADELAAQYLMLAERWPIVVIGSELHTAAFTSDGRWMDIEWLGDDRITSENLNLAVDMAVLKYQLGRSEASDDAQDNILSRDAFFHSASSAIRSSSADTYYFQMIQCRWVKPADAVISWQDREHLSRRFDRFLSRYVNSSALIGNLMDEQSGMLSVNELPLDQKNLDRFRQLCAREFSDMQVVLYMSTPARVRDSESLALAMQQAVQEIARDKLVREARFEWQSFQQANIGLMDSMHLALQRQEFFLQYQPQMDVGSGEWVGAEALIRWQHPGFGVLPPTAFIREAEVTGLIQVLGRWALIEAIQAWQTIYADCGKQITMAVNIAFPQAADEHFANEVISALAEHNMPAECLELELTETTVIRDEAVTMSNLKKLLQTGVRISLDDFGTGFSSLSHLSDLPITGIKLDRAFVSPLPEEGAQAHIASAMVSLARALKLETTAEGVEDERCMEKIKQLGCDRVQGYHLSRPISLEDLLIFAEKRSDECEVTLSGNALSSGS